jgi:ComF family protein
MAVNLNMLGNLRQIAVRLGESLWPARCLVCSEAGTSGVDLCAACRGDLPWNDRACARCALPLPISAPLCGTCLKAPPPFAACLAPLRYAAPLDRLLPRFKFHAGLAEGRLLAELIRAQVAPEAVQGLEAVVAMPLHESRLGRRGYNQALELARPLAHAWRLPLLVSALRRVRDTAPQSELDAEARRRNVRGAFSAEGELVRERRVLLIDDVITTGATVREAAAALLAAGAAEVRVLAAARAAAPGRA